MRKIICRSLALLLISILLFCILSEPFRVLAFEAEEELARLRAEQEELALQLAQAQSSLSAFENEQTLHESNMSWLLDRDEEQRESYEKQLKQISALVMIKQSLDKSLEIAISQYETMKATYAKRMEAMYQMSGKSQLELLLESDDLEAYFTTLKMMKLISDADEQSLEELRQMRDKIRIQREETIAELAKLEEVRVAMEADLYAIEQDLQLTQSNVAALDAEKQAIMDAIAAYTEGDFQLRAGIEAAEAELAEQQRIAAEQAAAAAAAAQGELGEESPSDPGYAPSGSFVWPVPSCWEISSPFGYRNIPEAGINDYHTGIDIPADWNAEAVAAASGTVVFVGWLNEYGGNTVKVDVGGGVTIMYCHLADFAAGTGDYVSAGQTVGYVGSSGYSTGPHLHFEVQVGGNPVDPTLYVG